MMDFVFKMMDFELKMMNFGRRGSWCLTHEARDGVEAPLRILCIDGAIFKN